MRQVAVAALIAGMMTTAAVEAQTRERSTRSAAAPPASDAGAIGAGWTAIAAGQYDEAVKRAETILRRRPWDRAALVLKISAHSAAAPLRGLDAYEQWINARHAD